MAPPLPERRQDAVPGYPSTKLFNCNYADEEIDGHVHHLTSRFSKHCSSLPQCADGSVESSCGPWLRKSADYDGSDTFWSPSTSDAAQHVRIHHGVAWPEDHSRGEHEKMNEGEREAYKAKHDLRDLFDIEPSLGSYKPVKLDELSTFLASLGSFGAQGSEIHGGNLERHRAKDNRWACRRVLRDLSNTSDDECECCDIAFRRCPAKGSRRTA